MDDKRAATGVAAALLIDTLLRLGIDDPLALTYDQQVAAVEQAASEGRIDAAQFTALRDLGALPPREN